MKKSICVLAIAVIMISCKEYKETNKALWLIANWENDSHAGKLVESWSKFNDSTLIGYGCFIVGKDTVFSEDLQIQQRGEDLFYIAKVADQNNSKPVLFKLTSSTENELVFENPEHDFPQKIHYRLISRDSLVAKVSGIKDGKENNETFSLKRVK